MKRYMTFSGYRYYPGGGMDDFKGDFDTLDEAITFIKGLANENCHDWLHVWDTIENVEVWREI